MQDILHGAQVVCIYFALAATTALMARKTIKIPDEIFRKSLHFILLLSYIPFAFAFDIWRHSVLVTIILELLIFPALALAEKPPFFSQFVTEHKKTSSNRVCCWRLPCWRCATPFAGVCWEIRT